MSKILLLFCLLAAAVLSGCGVQGEPLPPLLDVPMAAQLTAAQRGPQALLTWTLPGLTTEGQAVRPDKLGSAEVYRAVLPGLRRTVSQPEFEAVAQRIAEVPPSQTRFTDDVVRQSGQTLAYAVRLLNRRKDSAGFSNLVTVPVLAAPQAVSALAAKSTERAIELSWAPVSGATAYNVYKADGEGPLNFAAAVPSTSYADTSFEFGRAYRYMVRAVAAQGDFQSESADSPAASVQQKDVFPPQVPAGLAAVPTDAPPAVDLSWDAGPDLDLAGYNLYRGENGAAPQKLNPQLLVSPVYRDRAVRPAVSYVYTVTSVDRTGNESVRAEPVAVTLMQTNP